MQTKTNSSLVNSMIYVKALDFLYSIYLYPDLSVSQYQKKHFIQTLESLYEKLFFKKIYI